MVVCGILLSLTQVLAAAPAWFFTEPRCHRLCREMRVYSIALAMGFSLGLAAGAPHPVRLGLPVEKISGLYGALQDDPRGFNDGRGMGYLGLQGVMGAGGLRASAAGKILVFFPAGAIPRLKEFGRASEVYIEGAFLAPGISEKKTDASGNQARAFRAGSVHITLPAPGLEQFRTSLRMNLVERLATPAWGGLALALLLGVRDTLDTDLAEAYRKAGCSHVLALSGLHLAMVSSMIAFFLRKPLGLQLAAMMGALFIIGYIYLVGDLPSLHRAAIMYLLGTLAVMGALPRQPASLLGMSFLIQIVVQRESGHTISCILSYLALGGILFIGEALHDLIRGKIPEVLAQGLAASLGAFIATVAVVSWCFGMVRPVGIIAGLLIVPLTTLFMAGAMAVLALDVLAPCLAGPVGMILSLLYDGLEQMVSLAALVPGISIPGMVLVLTASLGVSILIMFLRMRQTVLRSNLVPFN